MRTAGKVGLAVAAAFGLAYAGYAIRGDSNNSTQNKPLEETVCKEVDTQAIYDKGESRGYMIGFKAGRREGEVIGEREGRKARLEQCKEYEINECNDQKYKEGLKACDDTKYADGLIEGEQLGLEESRGRFLGSGTEFINHPDEFIFHTSRINQNDDTKMIYTIRIGKGQNLCAKEVLRIIDPK
ncbi:MAG: hypothetical protein V1734_06585 [Nanoarchaeota archaeon]